MFPFFLLLVASPFPWMPSPLADPAPGLGRSKQESRDFECAQISQAEASARNPGLSNDVAPRGEFATKRAVTCKTRYFGFAERPGREEAILTRLSETVTDLVSAADDGSLAKATWLVDSYYPDATVAGKLSFAAKVALVERGRRVSDRVPVLAAGDILVLGKLPARRSYPLACARYWAEGSLAGDEVLLGVVLADEAETTLHAGVCSRGNWRWVR